MDTKKKQFQLFKITLIFSLLFSFVPTSFAEIKQAIKFCGDGGGWPPYTYKKDGEVIGYDVDVLNAILGPKNIKYTIAMPVWKRCVEGTKIGLYDAALSATFSEERKRNFIFTDSYYSLTPVYIYSKKQFPDGLQISNVKDLEKYHLCGVHGFNYDGVGSIAIGLIARRNHSIN